jgi:hypothetical protein
VRIKLRAYFEEGDYGNGVERAEEPCLLVPLEMSPRLNATRVDGEQGIVTCAVLSGGDRMTTMGFSLEKFHSMPLRELELIEPPPITKENLKALLTELDKAPLFASVKQPTTWEEGPNNVVFLRDADGHIFASMPRDVFEELREYKKE